MTDLNNTTPIVEDATVKKIADILKRSKGTVKISFNNNPGISISLGSNDVRLDVEDPSVFENIDLNDGSNSSGFF